VFTCGLSLLRQFPFSRSYYLPRTRSAQRDKCQFFMSELTPSSTPHTQSTYTVTFGVLFCSSTSLSPIAKHIFAIILVQRGGTQQCSQYFCPPQSSACLLVHFFIHRLAIRKRYGQHMECRLSRTFFVSRYHPVVTRWIILE
jgi:hypothetical protein